MIPDGLSPAAFALRDARGSVTTLSGRTMGTGWSVRFVPPGGAVDLRYGIETVLDEVVWEMSGWEPGSDLNRFNRAPASSWHELPSGFFTVLAAALDAALDSRGAFDPTVGGLVNEWGFGPSPFAGGEPADAVLDALRQRPGWRQIELDAGARRALQPGGVTLDLNGIAKGYAVDRIAAYLRESGVVHFLAEIGGEYVGEGIKPDGQPWWLDIELPPGAALSPLRIALHSLAAATSGDYRRMFESGGRAFSHTIDPRTGRPIAHGVASVTVLHRNCMWADAFATAISVLGKEEGLAFAEQRGVAAYMVTRHGDGFAEAMSPAFAQMLG